MVATILKSSYLAFIYSAFVGINEDVIKRYSEDEVCLCLDLASVPRQGTVPSLNLDRWLQDPLGMVSTVQLEDKFNKVVLEFFISLLRVTPAAPAFGKAVLFILSGQGHQLWWQVGHGKKNNHNKWRSVRDPLAHATVAAWTSHSLSILLEIHEHGMSHLFWKGLPSLSFSFLLRGFTLVLSNLNQPNLTLSGQKYILMPATYAIECSLSFFHTRSLYKELLLLPFSH